jgi:hypothetical protein
MYLFKIILAVKTAGPSIGTAIILKYEAGNQSFNKSKSTSPW